MFPELSTKKLQKFCCPAEIAVLNKVSKDDFFSLTFCNTATLFERGKFQRHLTFNPYLTNTCIGDIHTLKNFLLNSYPLLFLKCYFIA